MAKKSDAIKGLKLNWWQAGLFKTAAVSFGILLGIYFFSFLAQYTTLFWITFIVPGLYILYLWMNQK